MSNAEHADHEQERTSGSRGERQGTAPTALPVVGMSGFLLHLQRTAGNQAVNLWLREYKSGQQARSGPAAPLQRQTAGGVGATIMREPQAATATLDAAPGIPALLQKYPKMVVATRLRELTAQYAAYGSGPKQAFMAQKLKVEQAIPPHFSEQDLKSLAKAGKSAEVLQVKSDLSQDQINMNESKAGIAENKSHLDNEIADINGLFTAIQSAKLRQEANQDQVKLQAMQDKLDKVKTAFGGIGNLGGAVLGELAGLLVTHAVEGTAQTGNKRKEDFANIGVTQVLQNGLPMLAGLLTGLSGNIDDLQNSIQGNVAKSDELLITSVQTRFKAHSQNLPGIITALQTRLQNIKTIHDKYSQDLARMASSVGAKLGRSGPKGFKDISDDTRILDAFEEGSHGVDMPLQELKAKLESVKLLLAGPLFSDPDAKLARDYLEGLSTSEQAIVDGGRAKAAALRASVAQATTVGMDAVAAP